MKGVQCYELFGGIALKNHTFSFFSIFHSIGLKRCLTCILLSYICKYIYIEIGQFNTESKDMVNSNVPNKI